MRKLAYAAMALVLAGALCPAATAKAALLDQYYLSQDPTFVARVRTAMAAAAVAISNEGSGVTNHTLRDNIAVNSLTSPDTWKILFAAAAANDSTVASQATQANTVAVTATSSATQGALVTDAAINNAISAAWNSFFAH